MSDNDYSKREVDLIISEIRGIYQAHSMEDSHNFRDIKESIQVMTEQVKKTNGRVTVLERWQSFTMGGITVISMIVIPILSWALWILVNIDGKVHDAVDDALSAYDISYEAR